MIKCGNVQPTARSEVDISVVCQSIGIVCARRVEQGMRLNHSIPHCK